MSMPSGLKCSPGSEISSQFSVLSSQLQASNQTSSSPLFCDGCRNCRAAGHRRIHFRVAEELRGRLGKHRVDEHAGTEFEAGDACQTRNHAQIPVEVLHTNAFGRGCAYGQVEIRILQSEIQLREQSAQEASEIGDLLSTDVAEAGHVPSGIDVRAE